MRVISKARLRQFWESATHRDAEGPLRAWYIHVSSRTVSWQSWGDVKASLGNASIGGDCVVFNISGNKYRMICRVRYPTQKVFVLRVMTHREYDEGKWKDQCGCFKPPPPPTRKRAVRRHRRRR
jgi:mRNA interferase HigB